jgi:hypothetical protein
MVDLVAPSSLLSMPVQMSTQKFALVGSLQSSARVDPFADATMGSEAAGDERGEIAGGM